MGSLPHLLVANFQTLDGRACFAAKLAADAHTDAIADYNVVRQISFKIVYHYGNRYAFSRFITVQQKPWKSKPVAIVEDDPGEHPGYIVPCIVA